MAPLNFATIREWPTPPMVRGTALLAIVWSLIALAEFVIYAIFVAPSLNDTFHVAMPTKRGTLDFEIETLPSAWVGLIVTIAAILISVVWMLLIPRLLRASYVWFVCVSAFIAAYATTVLVSGIAALDGPDQTGVDYAVSFVPLALFVVGFFSISAVYGHYTRGTSTPVASEQYLS